MKVKQLIAILTEFDQDAKVIAEGCDCSNEIIGVKKREGREGISILVENGESSSAT